MYSQKIGTIFSRIIYYIRLVPYWAPMVPIWIFFKFLCRGKIEGSEIIKELKSRGFVIAANHVSYMDWIILHLYFLFVHHIKIAFFAKDKVLDHKVWRWMVVGGNCIRVNRNRVVNNHDTRQILQKSKYFVIFPEGTRSPTGQLIRGQPGVVKIAFQTGFPIIPCGLIGFYKCWPRHRKLPRINCLKIVFGKPYHPLIDEINSGILQMESHKIMRMIANLTGQLYEH